MPVDVLDTGAATIPNGYRQAVVTAITVFLGFSLAFLRYWGIENPGAWTEWSVSSAILLGVGIAVQFVGLVRALDLRDEERPHYRATVRWFTCGATLVGLAVVWSIVIAA